MPQKPYAIYIHGLGSGAASGTKSSLARYFTEYEWINPEVTHDPYESIPLLDEWARTFNPALIAGTSMGGLYALYVNCPSAMKLAVNPAMTIETVLRKLGYGKYKYTCEREDGVQEYVIDEALARRFIQFRKETAIICGVRNVAVFSTDDEFVGREISKKSAAELEKLQFEIYWSDKFGHRLNEQIAKNIVGWMRG